MAYSQDNIAVEEWAAGVVNANGTVIRQRGCAFAAHTPGSGVYRFELDRALSENECDAHVTLRTPQAIVNLTVYVNHVSDTVKEVQIVNASVGSDQGFAVSLRKIL